MKWVVILVSLVVLSIIQSVLPQWQYMGDIKWPLVCAAVFYHSLTYNRSTALISAIVAGFLYDAQANIPLGYTSFALCIPAWWLNSQKDKIFVDEWLTQMLIGGGMAVMVTAVTGVLLILGEHLEIYFSGLLLKCCGVALLSLLAMPLVSRVLHQLDLRLGLQEERRY